MEMEKEWKGMEEKVEEVVEEMEESSLKIRRRNRGKMVNTTTEAPVEEEDVENGDKNNVYFDEAQGVWKCRHCTWTYQLRGFGIDHIQKHEGNCRGTMDVEIPTQDIEYKDKNADPKFGVADHFVAEKTQGNGKADFRANDFKNQDKFFVIEENQNCKTVILENVSDYIKDEIEEIKTVGLKTLGKLEATEFDVERVLEEQETHDLYCPNCNSCITKRVILRKRKRIGGGSQHGLPPEKRPVPGDIPAPPVPGELDHEKEPVFRCLSCFSFFIPTETGFNIFRIFGKREENKNLQSVQPPPARNMNWLSSIFGSETSKKKDNERGPTPTLEVKESSPPLVIPGATEVEDSGAATGNNYTVGQYIIDVLPVKTYPDGRGQMDNQAKEEMQNSLDTTISEGNLGEPHTTPGKFSSGGGDNTALLIDKASFPEATVLLKEPPLGTHSNQYINGSVPPNAAVLPPNDINSSIGMDKPTSSTATTQDQNIQGPVLHPAAETHINLGDPSGVVAERTNDWDVLKSIVYGGLIESITSLGVVSSAAGSDSSTLNICALGLANLIGGLFVIAHDLSALRSNEYHDVVNARNKQAGNTEDHEVVNVRHIHDGRYWEQLGKRENIRRHVVVSILSYIFFGLLPPVLYGFSFLKSDNKEYKLIVVAAASLLCIALLAIGKAHVKPQKDYFKSLFYYVVLGISASGISYVAGAMINRLLLQLGLFDENAAASSPPASIQLFGLASGKATSAFF